MRKRGQRHERTASLAELAAAELASPLQRGKLNLVLEDIGYRMAEQLHPALRTRVNELPDNEVMAALDAVAATLGKADLSDNALFAANVDAEALAQQVRTSVPELPRQAYLSAAAERLYDLALDQSCRYLVQAVQHLTAFPGRALPEILDQLSTNTAQLTELLDRTPRTSLLAPHGTDNDAEFHERYLQHISSTMDKLELLGLSMRHRPRLALSTAYLSLSVSGDVRDRRVQVFGLADRWLLGDRSRTDISGVRVEAAIGGPAPTLVLGAAGSGKTTLLDWLAVTAARSGFTDQLRDWNNCVPFPIRLRRYVNDPLPRPEDFLAYSAGWLKGIMPSGWVHRCLNAGTALVLVDGVDEVPADKRRAIRTWLDGLVKAYPKAQVVVTSRPGAVEKKWLADEGFASVQLEPMSAADIRAFVQRWHAAAAHAASLPCEPDDLPAAERRLLAQFDAGPHLRDLAINPLTCAMLCALNLQQTSGLPQDRMELYRAALNMLLDLRDAERGIARLLDASRKTRLLGDLAWRLTLAGQTELPKQQALEHVAAKIPAMPDIDMAPAILLDHLLERSGVIREPIPGRVDFVHRTFQEYLAASEATEDRHIDTLVSHAHLDSWSGTIVMACGHAKRQQRRDLLTAILDRADAEPRRARKLRLLAATCLETATDVDPDVRARIDQAIQARLVPPRDVRESQTLASIGYRVLRYLPESIEELTTAKAVATVRTAALTANPEALKRLARYAQDPRSRIQLELVRCWTYFDPERYAREVLTDAPLDAVTIYVTNRSIVPYVRYLANARDVRILCTEHVTDLEFLADISNVRFFSAHCQGIIDLDPLTEQHLLEGLFLDGASSYSSVGSLGVLTDLERLSLLLHRQAWHDIDFVRSLPSLGELSLDGLHDVEDYDVFSEAVELEDLSLENSAKLINLAPIRHLSNLQGISLTGSRIRNIAQQIADTFPQLESVHLADTDVSDLTPLAALPLAELNVAGCPVRDLSPLAGKTMHLGLSRGQEYAGLDRLDPGVEIEYWD